jgi:beta-mannosidase
MTIGPWKPIALETYSTRISDVDVRVDVSEDFFATINVALTLSSEEPVVASVHVKNPAGDRMIGRPSDKMHGTASMSFGMSKDAYELWWPVGYGKQTLYAVEIIISDEVRNSCRYERDDCGQLLLYCLARKPTRPEGADYWHSSCNNRTG